MEDNNMNVPYIVYEGAMARMERANRRLMISLIVSIIIILLSNLAWLYLWNSYEYVGDSVSYEQDGEGVNIIGDRNNYGTENNESDEISQEEER